MKEFGKTQSEREIARLKQRNSTKSPVKENVKKFEAQSQSPTPETSRGKSPSISNQRPNTLSGSPTRGKSPGLSSPLRSKSPGVQTPTRSKSPGVQTLTRSKSPGFYSPTRNESPNLGSPSRSKSPGVYSSNRGKSPALHSPTRGVSPGIDNYNRGKSPGIDAYAGRKSPGNNTINRAKSPLSKTRRPNQLFSPTRSISPEMIAQSPGSSPTKSPVMDSAGSKSPGTSTSGSKSPGPNVGRSKSPGPNVGGYKSPGTNVGRSKSPGTNASGSKWTMGYKGWAKESPVVAETTENFEGTPDHFPSVGDEVDISWYFDNIDYVTDSKAEETYAPAVEDVWPGAENSGAKSEQRFRNTLNYNITAWNNEERNEDRPKKADEFIQRLCDQVRNMVEYLCGMDFVKYQAVSYKVRVAGSEGIFYYIKVNVWQDYCLHLRIFSYKNELKAIPTLQAILERAQPDNGNIEFF